MENSIYSLDGFRPELIADAMISVGNLYPGKNVRLLPIIDTLSLLVQQPLCFSFFRKESGNTCRLLRTTMCDPDLEIQFGPVVRQMEKNADQLIPIPTTDIFLGIRAIRPRPNSEDGTLKADFPPLDSDSAFRQLFDVLQNDNSGLGKKVLEHIKDSLNDSQHDAWPSNQKAESRSYWDKRRTVVSGARLATLIESLRPIVDGALAPIAESPLINQLLGKNLPFTNLFCVVRTATNDKPRNSHFPHTAQVLLSTTQKAAIANKFGKSTPSLLEFPLGAGARSIADSVFYSGAVDFSDEQAGKGRDLASNDPQDQKRQSAEEKVYQTIAEDRHIFYVPIHVNGTPWFALFAISPKSEENVAWARNYALYRSLISGVAENIRSLAKSAYLKQVNSAFVEEYRELDKASFVKRFNKRCSELLLVFPFPGVRLTSANFQATHNSTTLPDSRTVEIETFANPWFKVEIEFNALDPKAIKETCEQAVAEVQRQSQASRLEWEAQQHTIFNIIPTRKLQKAIKQPVSELSGQARTYVEDAGKAVDIMEQALSIAFGREAALHLPTSVAALLKWFAEHTLSAECQPTLNLPRGNADFVLNQNDLPNAFTVLWNLWHNAANHSPEGTRCFWVEAEWNDDQFMVCFENEGALGKHWIEYLLQPEVQNPSRGKGMRGLIIVKTKMQALGWVFHKINVQGGKTQMVIVLENKRGRGE